MAAHPETDVSAEHGRTGGAATGERSSTFTFRAKCAAAAGLVAAALITGLLTTAYTDVGTIPGLPPVDPLVHFGLPAARILLDLSAVATVGLSLLPKLVGFDRPRLTEPIMSVARRATVITALVWTTSALLSLLLQAAELTPGQAPTTASVVEYVAAVPAGPGLVLSAVAGLLCGLVGLLAVRHGESVPAELRVLIAVLGLLPMPLTGHATNWDYHDFSMISMELHVVSAAIWTGGLGALVLLVAPRRGLLAEALPRFSKLAGLALVVVGISGAFNGLMELALTPGVGLMGLFSTGYGQIVLVKMICLVALGLFGAYLRFRLLPMIARHQRTALIGWVAAEITIMGIAYGLGAVLARAPVIV